MGWIEDNTNKDPIAKVGMRIRMLNMEDEFPVDEGMEGTIYNIDDLGTLHVKWDDGRNIGIIPGIDEYQVLPPEDEQIDFNIFEGSDFKLSKATKKISRTSKPVKKMAAGLNKLKKYDIKVESEEVPGGEAEGMTAKDLAKKHGVSVKDIEKEIEVGTKIEMEHTDSKKMAKEIAMDHIAEFPDYYTNKKYGVKASEKGLEKVLEEEITTGNDIIDTLLGIFISSRLYGVKTKEFPQYLAELGPELILSFMKFLRRFGYSVDVDFIRDNWNNLLKKALGKHYKKGGIVEPLKDILWNGGTINYGDGTSLTINKRKKDNYEEEELEETTTAGSAGAYNAPLFGKQTKIRKPKAKETSSYVITKGDLKNPLGKVYSLKSESKVIKAKDFISEIASTHAAKLRNAEGTFDGDPWVGKKGWLRRKELAWKGGEISDILAKLDINWNDSNLSLTDKETDKINEGWLKKTKEDKLVLEILERVKEEYPQDTEMRSFSYGSGNYIEFTLEGLRGNVKVRLESSYSYGDLRDSYGLWVNNRELLASRWAIKKLYKYISKEFTKRKEAEDLKNIETDLISPDYAEDVFDMLGDSEQVNEAKKSKESPIHTKKWERCVKDVEKKNKENKTDYNPYAVCQKSIGYEGSIKKPHRRKEKEEIEETTTFSSVFGGGFPVTPFMFAKKGKHIPSKKPIWKGGKIVQKADKADLLGEGNAKLFNEVNKVKWVKGGKFVKIKDRCAKYNNKPWCSQGAIDNPLELSDTVFENIEKISKKTGLSEEYIYNKIISHLNKG